MVEARHIRPVLQAGAGDARVSEIEIAEVLQARERRDAGVGNLGIAAQIQELKMACLGNPDPADMKVYCPEGKETFDDDATTEEAPS